MVQYLRMKWLSKTIDRHYCHKKVVLYRKCKTIMTTTSRFLESGLNCDHICHICIKFHVISRIMTKLQPWLHCNLKSWLQSWLFFVSWVCFWSDSDDIFLGVIYISGIRCSGWCQVSSCSWPNHKRSHIQGIEQELQDSNTTISGLAFKSFRHWSWCCDVQMWKIEKVWCTLEGVPCIEKVCWLDKTWGTIGLLYIMLTMISLGTNLCLQLWDS